MNPVWTGTQAWCLTDPEGVLTITAEWDCEGQEWIVSAVVEAGGDSDTFGPEDFTLTQQWCGPDAPDGFPEMPFFRGYFTVSPERAAEHPLIYPGCEEGGTFGTGEPTVAECADCPAPPPAVYELDLTATASGSCGDCSPLATVVPLNFIEECHWASDAIVVCGDSYVFDLVATDGGGGTTNFTLIIKKNGGGELSYFVALTGCDGPMNLVKTVGTATNCLFPDPIPLAAA